MKKQYVLLILMICIIPFAFAGTSEWFSKLTGKATSQPVDLEISVGGGTPPSINVLNETMTDTSFGPNEGPTTTPITIRFTAYDPEGSANLNDSTAKIEFIKAGEMTKTDNQCSLVASNETTNTYECELEMVWWDAPGKWEIKAEISDINNNLATDQNKSFQLGATTGFVAAPLTVNWEELNPGSTQVQANNSITINNTGNIARNIEMNSTNLIGAIDPSKIIYANNFTLNTDSTCGGTQMQRLNYTQISGANLPRGNYTIGDGTGQEKIFFCLEKVGSDLTQQIYSTSQEGAWTMRIAA